MTNEQAKWFSKFFLRKGPAAKTASLLDVPSKAESRILSVYAQQRNRLRNEAESLRKLTASGDSGEQGFLLSMIADKANEEVAVNETAKELGVSYDEVNELIAARIRFEPYKSYAEGSAEHSRGDFLAARHGWTKSAAAGHGESMIELGAYFMRGYGEFPYSYVGARSLFEKALSGELEQAHLAFRAKDGISRIDRFLSASAIKDAASLESSIVDILVSGTTQSICEEQKGVEITFSYLLFPGFPNSPRLSGNAIGFWDARIPDDTNAERRARFVQWSGEVNAAKALRGKLGIRERNIYSDESGLRSMLIPVQRRLVEDGYVFGMIKHRG